MKIARNCKYGGFELYDEILHELGVEYTSNLNNDFFNIVSDNIYEYRSHPVLINILENYIDEDDDIEIAEIPDDVIYWELFENDGIEHIEYISKIEFDFLRSIFTKGVLDSRYIQRKYIESLISRALIDEVSLYNNSHLVLTTIGYKIIIKALYNINVL